MEDERAKLKQELLEELKAEYYLKPKSQKLEVADIFEKYENELLNKEGYESKFGVTVKYSQFEAIKQAIRKCVCMHFGVQQLKFIPSEKYEIFRKEIERFIIEYILGGE